jgi:hypothetical protein
MAFTIAYYGYTATPSEPVEVYGIWEEGVWNEAIWATGVWE